MNNKTQKSGFLFRHRFSVGFFVFLALYNYIIVNRLKFWEVDSGGTYLHHIIDYKSLGFRSGLLPGSVYYGIFGENSSVKTASIYETVLILLFFIGMSVMLEKFIYKVNEQYRSTALVLVFLYISGPFTFSTFTDTLGMLDVYWLFFSLAFFFVLDNKVLSFFIPVLFALSLMVHMSAVLCYLIMFSILILYRLSLEQDGKKKKSYTAVFVLSMVATAFLAVFFLVFKKDMPMTVEEFNGMLEKRGGTYFAYYDYTFYDYNIYKGTGLYPAELYDIESPVWRAIRLAIQRIYFLHTEFIRDYTQNRSALILRAVSSLLILSPVMFFFYRHMRRFYKSIDSNKLKKFSVFLMMVQFPFTVITGNLVSLDVNRFFTHAFLISFTMFLYVMYKEEDFRADVLETVERIKTMPATYIYCLGYFFVNFSAYS